MKQGIFTDQAPSPIGAYSPAVRAGDWIFISGQGPEDPLTHQVKGTTIEEQTRHTLDNLFALLTAAGGKADDVVQVQVFLADLADFAGFNRVYAGYFSDPKPARATVGCQLLNQIKVEIAATAFVG